MTSDKQKHKASKLEQFQLPQDPNAPDIIRLVHRFAAVVDAFPSNLMKTLGDLKELDAVLNGALFIWSGVIWVSGEYWQRRTGETLFVTQQVEET
ncbi:hypothetical protein BT69DRAFT_877970 [Atractiella rhizophila]|nr:hypothetical protein BT69DRAFT_877970 [Atractiella rhizophila]